MSEQTQLDQRMRKYADIVQPGGDHGVGGIIRFWADEVVTLQAKLEKAISWGDIDAYYDEYISLTMDYQAMQTKLEALRNDITIAIVASARGETPDATRYMLEQALIAVQQEEE